MGPDDIAFVKAMIIAVLVAGTSLSFYAIRLRHRGPGNPQLDRDVQDQLEQEAAQRAALEARLAELEERVDFTERRLIQQRPDLPATTPV